MTEGEYLQRQAELAKNAMRTTLAEMKDAAVELADPRVWTREHPLISLGVSAGLGFALASALTPAREQTFSDRMHSLFPESKQPAVCQPPAAAEPSKTKKAAKMLLTPLRRAVITALLSSLTAKATAQQNVGADNSAHQGERASDPTAAW